MEIRVGPEEARRYRDAGWWRDRTVIDDFKEVTARHADKVAIVSDHAAGPPEVLSFRQLARMVDRFAGGLLELGVKPGDVVAMQLPNWWQFAALALATIRVGGVVNPIIPILRRREVGFILERVGTRVCVVPTTYRNFAHGEMLTELASEIPTLEHAFVIGDPVEGTRQFDAHFVAQRWEDQHPASELDRLATGADELAQIQYTSGTTGEPKGVAHSHNTLFAGTRAVPDMLGLTEDDVVLMASTMAHQTGFLYGLLMPVSTGMKVVYQDVWVPDRALELIQDEGVTWTMGATPFVMDSVAAQRKQPRDLHTLRLFSCAGSPIPPHLVKAAREVLGAQLTAIWGMTENGAVTFTGPGDPPDFASQSDGRPVPGMELKVVDDEGQEVAPGTVGNLMARGASQCLGYFRRPDLYAGVLTPEGWFHTGDLARMDATGAIRITGRTKDVILRGGENIPVLEIEAALYRMPSVREVAVVAVPDERMGERACAVVVPEGEPPTLDDIRAHLGEMGMAKVFWPERVEVVSELPKTPSGKVQKFRLREQFDQGEV
ncbi:MAG TPA: long-chain fatty acid--CoA ligase [Arthrobacter bacterium]|jgi:cyclohexanecarboxylate-CoA ligase|nr:long-chain fatty acid--CoA ligase [Arthrobacter sp.]